MASSKEALESLHKALAETLATAITEGIPMKDDDTGVITKAPAPAALLSVARQFLKDNGIEALAVPGTPVHKLSASLPFTGEDDGGGYSARH
jgi:hypothetical protein